jgi:hypothetical protein
MERIHQTVGQVRKPKIPIPKGVGTWDLGLRWDLEIDSWGFAVNGIG